MSTITIRNRHYTIYHEQNSYYAVYQIADSGRWYRVTDEVEASAIVEAQLESERESQHQRTMDELASMDDELAATGRM